MPGVERPAGRRETDRSAVAREVETPATGPILLPQQGRSLRIDQVSTAALARHDVSEAELRSKLLARSFDEVAVEGEIARLAGVGLVDDEALAARLVGVLRERKGLGDAGVRSALATRRIPVAVIDAALGAAAEDADVAEARLQEVADDRARRLGRLAPEVAERRLLAYLGRKGYSGNLRSVVREALSRAGHPAGR